MGAFETAVKSIWLLYARGRWMLLEQIGLPRAEYELLFQSFDFLYLPDSPPESPLSIGRMTTQSQINNFLRLCPQAEDAADYLVDLYETGKTL